MASREVLERALAQCREAREEIFDLSERDVRAYWIRFKAMNKKIITEKNAGINHGDPKGAKTTRSTGEVAPIVIRPKAEGLDAKILIRWRQYPNSVKRLKGSTKKEVGVRTFGESINPKKDGHYSLSLMKRICQPWEYGMVKDFETRFVEHRESLDAIHESIKKIKSALRRINKQKDNEDSSNDN